MMSEMSFLTPCPSACSEASTTPGSFNSSSETFDSPMGTIMARICSRQNRWRPSAVRSTANSNSTGHPATRSAKGNNWETRSFNGRVSACSMGPKSSTRGPAADNPRRKRSDAGS